MTGADAHRGVTGTVDGGSRGSGDLTPAPGATEPVTDADRAAMSAQLGRPTRGLAGVAHRCPCGLPDVALTRPRLDDGTPFPTTFYLTCPRATGAVSTLESEGMMRHMTERLVADPDLAAAYRAAHEDYLHRRAALGAVPEIEGVSAGGMPHRVKCLHVLAAHALAAGPGVNPLGDEVLAALPPWWAAGPCVEAGAHVVRSDGLADGQDSAQGTDREGGAA